MRANGDWGGDVAALMSKDADDIHLRYVRARAPVLQKAWCRGKSVHLLPSTCASVPQPALSGELAPSAPLRRPTAFQAEGAACQCMPSVLDFSSIVLEAAPAPQGTARGRGRWQVPRRHRRILAQQQPPPHSPPGQQGLLEFSGGRTLARHGNTDPQLARVCHRHRPTPRRSMEGRGGRSPPGEEHQEADGCAIVPGPGCLRRASAGVEVRFCDAGHASRQGLRIISVSHNSFPCIVCHDLTNDSVAGARGGGGGTVGIAASRRTAGAADRREAVKR